MHRLAILLALALLAGCQVSRPAPDPAGFSLLPAPDPPQPSVRLASAEEPVPDQPRTLTDFERVARHHNPTLAAALANVERTRGHYFQAGLYPNPVIGYHAMQMGVQGTSGQQGAFLSQRIVTGGKLALDQSIADKGIDEAHARFHAQEQRVLSDVALRFYGALVAQQRVELTSKLAKIATDVVSATARLREGRQATENDLLQAKISADQTQILLDNAKNEHLASWRQLAAVVGVPQMKISPIVGDLADRTLRLAKSGEDEPDWANLNQATVKDHPQVMAAQARVQQAELALERAQVEPIPDIDLIVSHRHNNLTQDNVTNVQVGIPIPVFNKNQGNIRAAEARWMEARQDVIRIRLSLREQLAQAFRRWQNARQQVDRYQQRILPNAQKSLDIVTRAYEQGQAQYLTLLTTQRTHVRVNLDYLASLRELRFAAARIDGQMLSGSLAR